MEPDTAFRPTSTPIAIAKYTKPYEERRIETLARYIPDGWGRDALDLGSGPGYFSKLLSGRGWNTTSVDTDPENIESAKQSGGETRLGDAVSVLSSLPTDRFDFALALELIEHMPRRDGTAMAREILRVLKPAGTLILSTPNRFSLEGLIGYYWGEKLRGWGKWQAWDPTHVYLYTAGEIVRLLESCGLRVDQVIGYYYEGPVPIVGRVRLPLHSSRRWPLNRFGFNTILICRKPWALPANGRVPAA